MLVVLSAESRVVRERWEFDIVLMESEVTAEDGSVYVLQLRSSAAVFNSADAMLYRPSKPEKEIRAEIRAILKQIVGTNAYMPTLSGDACVFDILAYTEGDAEVPPEEWKDTHGHLIEADKAQHVKLKSFDTKLHRIDAMVAYRYEGSI